MEAHQVEKLEIPPYFSNGKMLIPMPSGSDNYTSHFCIFGKLQMQDSFTFFSCAGNILIFPVEDHLASHS
jgi:hypothetical protein